VVFLNKNVFRYCFFKVCRF